LLAVIKNISGTNKKLCNPLHRSAVEEEISGYTLLCSCLTQPDSGIKSKLIILWLYN